MNAEEACKMLTNRPSLTMTPQLLPLAFPEFTGLENDTYIDKRDNTLIIAVNLVDIATSTAVLLLENYMKNPLAAYCAINIFDHEKSADSTLPAITFREIDKYWAKDAKAIKEFNTLKKALVKETYRLKKDARLILVFRRELKAWNFTMNL